jgi:probable HAF family extracellular repeat protein
MDLGTLGGHVSFANRINDRGQVVGLSSLPTGEYRAFRTAPNRPIDPDADAIGGVFPPSPTKDIALAINDDGRVVGESLEDVVVARVLAPGDAAGAAADPGQELLGSLGPGPADNPAVAWPEDINDRGQVVGRSSHPALASYHAFRTAPNRPIDPASDDLGTLGGDFSEARAINARGQVAGDSELADTRLTHAFRTAPGRPIDPASDDLGTLSGPDGMSRGFAINDAGQVVGWSTTATGQQHAFRTAPNRPIDPANDDLGTLGGESSYARAINNEGHVVGRASAPPDPREYRLRSAGNMAIPASWRAFLHDGRRMHDLNALIAPDSGWFLYEATDINDRGQVVGLGICPEGKLHGFVLTPVPEPGQLVLVGLGTFLCGIGFHATQHRPERWKLPPLRRKRR